MESSVVRSWAFSSDGMRVATGSDDGTVRVWDLQTGGPLTPRLRHLGFVESVNFSPEGNRLLTTSDDVKVEHLMAEADPRLVLDSFTDAGLLAIGPRGAGLLKQLGLGSTAEWLISAHRPLAPLAIIRSARPTRAVLLWEPDHHAVQGLYVALTRASKSLTIVSCSRTLVPEGT
jgi:hypothetical protein